MDLDNELRLIIKEIYKKVINFVSNNKNNDDLFYKYMYLKAKNNMKIEYYFEIDEIKFRINRINISIRNGETIYFGARYSYDTSLAKKYIENPDHFELQLEKQNKLSEETKDSILNCYNEVNESLNELKYDRKKTYDIENFNDNFFDYYNEYMYEKEFSNLKESGGEILPSALIAAEWLKNKVKEVNTDIVPQDTIPLAYFKLLRAPIKITNKQYNKFRDILAKKIMNEILELDGDVVQIRCDYGPGYLLNEAGLEAGLKGLFTPTSTDVYIRAFWAGAKDGYGASCETLYDSTTKEDIEIIKKQYYEKNKVLKKEL